MFRLRRALVLLGILKLSLWVAWAQDLSPRAYVNTPLHSNAITLTYSYFNGSIDFNGLLPVTGAKGVYSVPIFTYYHAFALFGHSANFVVALPYGIGRFSGTTGGELVNQYRSGLTDSVYRFSVNLKGGPALAPREFVRWKQKTLIGMSLKMVAPTGQYDPTKLINWVATAGRSNRRLAFRADGRRPFLTHMAELGSILRTTTFGDATRYFRPGELKHERRLPHSKRISATISNPCFGSRSTAIFGGAALHRSTA
jgi:hypothetical protein